MSSEINFKKANDKFTAHISSNEGIEIAITSPCGDDDDDVMLAALQIIYRNLEHICGESEARRIMSGLGDKIGA